MHNILLRDREWLLLLISDA